MGELIRDNLWTWLFPARPWHNTSKSRVTVWIILLGNTSGPLKSVVQPGTSLPPCLILISILNYMSLIFFSVFLSFLAWLEGPSPFLFSFISSAWQIDESKTLCISGLDLLWPLSICCRNDNRGQHDGAALSYSASWTVNHNHSAMGELKWNSAWIFSIKLEIELS